MGLVLAAPVGAATAADEAAWSRVIPPNGAFSIETPCKPVEISALRVVPDAALPINNYAPGSRILCRKGGMVFMAGVVNTTDLPAGVSAYDVITEKVAKAGNVEGKPTLTTIGGRRALINRQVRNGLVGQTGFIEISPIKIITLVAGTEGDDASAAASIEAVDRFYASIKVAG
ncbi:hypothetical protein [Sphingomonas koreensis]